MVWFDHSADSNVGFVESLGIPKDNALAIEACVAMAVWRPLARPRCVCVRARVSGESSALQSGACGARRKVSGEGPRGRARRGAVFVLACGAAGLAVGLQPQ